MVEFLALVSCLFIGFSAAGVKKSLVEISSLILFAGKNRRRGRPPKNSNNELVYSPPEAKRARSSTDGVTVTLAAPSNISEQVSGLLAASAAAAAASSATVSLVSAPTGSGAVTPGTPVQLPQTMASTPTTASGSGSGGGGKGGKGIRNRVFCGECPGCLQNDDCGKCRYCKDKTKFGGQNRLRQKCLHRRCQMDTHR